jgi:hypothetical protein
MNKTLWILLCSAQTLVVALFFHSYGFAQVAKPVEEIGDAVVNSENEPWPSPESVLNDLRSPNNETRLKASKLAGLTDQQAHEKLWSQGNASPSKVIGEMMITPGRTDLMYAALGEDASQQAILAFEVPSMSFTYATVALQKGNRWERVVAFNCWCKYDMNLDQDALAEFVSLRPVPETDPAKLKHYELVVRSSSGGSGVYTQTETHLRLYHDQLHSVLSFVSSYHNGSPKGPTPSWQQLERRWFTFAPVPDGTLRGVLVEAKATFPADEYPEIEWTLQSLLDVHVKKITCRAFRWDPTALRYEPSSEAVSACEVPAKSPS